MYNLYLFQVEHLEVPSSQDKIFVFLHRGAIVGGIEVNKCAQKRSLRNDLHWLLSPCHGKCSVWMPRLWNIHTITNYVDV